MFALFARSRLITKRQSHDAIFSAAARLGMAFRTRKEAGHEYVELMPGVEVWHVNGNMTVGKAVRKG